MNGQVATRCIDWSCSRLRSDAASGYGATILVGRFTTIGSAVRGRLGCRDGTLDHGHDQARKHSGSPALHSRLCFLHFHLGPLAGKSHVIVPKPARHQPARAKAAARAGSQQYDMGGSVHSAGRGNLTALSDRAQRLTKAHGGLGWWAAATLWLHSVVGTDSLGFAAEAADLSSLTNAVDETGRQTKELEAGMRAVAQAKVAEQIAQQNVAAAQCARARALREAERAQREATRMRERMAHTEASAMPIAWEVNMAADMNQRVQARTAALTERIAAQTARLQMAADQVREISVQFSDSDAAVQQPSSKYAGSKAPCKTTQSR